MQLVCVVELVETEVRAGTRCFFVMDKEKETSLQPQTQDVNVGEVSKWL